MGTQALLPDSRMTVEQYLHTSFDGADREYLDGEVVERNMGTKSHGRVQGKLFTFFHNLEGTTQLFPVPELRHRITRTRYRIPDVAVFEGEPAELPSTPPLVAIEILSPDDRLAYLVPKLEEYRQWGVPHIWVVDPEARTLHSYSADGLQPVREFTLTSYGVTLKPLDIF